MPGQYSLSPVRPGAPALACCLGLLARSGIDHATLTLLAFFYKAPVTDRAAKTALAHVYLEGRARDHEETAKRHMAVDEDMRDEPSSDFHQAEIHALGDLHENASAVRARCGRI
ncbi:hypothetical protein LO772_30370 [Yinghuangia sp. ASG 101]|uniref:hypothetical protein n=1 Tax=Yinghuangia sp. ASG 101 TaxID=2896848 RepID=UPI001E4B36FE|nr:hypothetical protein [Yinghuangia sp. ASG 101]UGQ11067.1 hypothetical protein LO772_30370 [Yinghuangia sp. ASG 101]